MNWHESLKARPPRFIAMYFSKFWGTMLMRPALSS
jgi:hypothetical protein